MEINPIENLIKISNAASTSSILNKVSLADVDYVSDSDDEIGKYSQCKACKVFFVVIRLLEILMLLCFFFTCECR